MFRPRVLTCGFLAAALLASSRVAAELPPSVYEEKRSAAPEVHRIRVRDVSTGICIPVLCSNQSVTVQAEVIEVVRSGSGIRQGDRIEIRYDHFRPGEGWVGPSPIPILKKGAEYTAYLESDGKAGFRPGARGRSFDQ
jgi:hypothetical protein